MNGLETMLERFKIPVLLVIAYTLGRVIEPSGPTMLYPLRVDLDTGLPVKAASEDAEAPFFATVRASIAGQLPTPTVPAGHGGAGLPAWTPERCREYAPLFQRSAEKHGLEPGLLVAVAIAESGCQPEPSGAGCQPNHAGAMGMMQVVPKWHGLREWCEPEVAIDYAGQYLAGLIRNYGNVHDAIYHYNSGTLATAEGRSYRHFVGGMYDERDEEVSSRFYEWCRAGSGFGLPECQ